MTAPSAPLRRCAGIFVSLLLVALAPAIFAAADSLRISVADFGAIPDDGQVDTEGLRRALDECRAHPGSTLVIPPGTYRLRDEQAVKLMNDIMTGVISGNPQPTIFKPYYPYAKGLDFAGVKGLTVEATGAFLMMEGWGEPISLTHCSDITIKGLTIDYDRKPNTVGVITKVQADSFDLQCDPLYTLNPGMSLCRLVFWDPATRRYLNDGIFQPDYTGGDSNPKFEIPRANTLRIFMPLTEEMKGKKVVILHSFHFRPAIFFLEAANITLEDVTIHAQPGMGLVGHRSRDLTFRGLRVVPRAGQLVSSNTDATHFTSCAGTLTYENCSFEGQGDDAANIHTYYHTIEPHADAHTYHMKLVQADWHAGVLDHPDVGDSLDLVERQTLKPVRSVQVRQVEPIIPELRTRIVLDQALPPDLENYFLINNTRLPKVRITGCNVTTNRSRAFLIKSRDILIERNLIREVSGTGIHIGAEGGWHEGPASSNVIIRNNRFIRTGGGPGTIDGWAIAVSVHAKDMTVPGLHKNILIEGNIIDLENAKVGISIQGAADVIIRANEIAGAETPIKVEYSTNVRIEANPGVPDQFIEQ